MPDMNHPEDTSVRYEKSDARIGGIVAFGIMLVALVLAVHFTVTGLFDYLKASENRKYPPLPALAAKERLHLPRDPKDTLPIPPPRLQISETVDLDQLRKHEQSLLTNYGWADQKAGVVRIPINEAMDMLADPQTAAAHGIRVRAAKGSKK
jgi:hypothetical protein